MSIDIFMTELPSAIEAIRHADNDGQPIGVAIVMAGRFFVVAKIEARQLEAIGSSFAYLHEVAVPDGTPRIVTVPVN